MPSWNIARVYGKGESVDCLVLRDHNLFRLLSYSDLPVDPELRIRMMSGETVAGLLVGKRRSYSVGGGTVHFAVLSADAQRTAGFHREPTWTLRKRGA